MEACADLFSSINFTGQVSIVDRACLTRLRSLVGFDHHDLYPIWVARTRDSVVTSSGGESNTMIRSE